MIKKLIIIIIIISLGFCIKNPSVFHGIGFEMTQNGAGVFYSPEFEKPNIYTKIGLHFERSNITEVNPYFNTQNPGFNKTMGLISIGYRKVILKNYFSNNMSIHILGEYTIGNNMSNLFKGKINPNNNRFVTGFSLQIPSGKIIKRYDICFQTINKISGVLLVRFHFLKKLL